MTASMPDPEAERIAHALAGCDWSPWYMEPCPGWKYWRLCQTCGAHEFTMDRPSVVAPGWKLCEATTYPQAPSIVEIERQRLGERIRAGKAAANARRAEEARP